MLKEIAMDVRNSDEFKELFVADPQVLGVDAVKGSEQIFPVVFKTLADKTIRPRARVQAPRPPGPRRKPPAPRRPLSASTPATQSSRSRTGTPSGPSEATIPTTIKPQESNPFNAG